MVLHLKLESGTHIHTYRFRIRATDSKNVLRQGLYRSSAIFEALAYSCIFCRSQRVPRAIPARLRQNTYLFPHTCNNGHDRPSDNIPAGIFFWLPWRGYRDHSH